MDDRSFFSPLIVVMKPPSAFLTKSQNTHILTCHILYSLYDLSVCYDLVFSVVLFVSLGLLSPCESKRILQCAHVLSLS